MIRTLLLMELLIQESSKAAVSPHIGLRLVFSLHENS
ncbi:unnamed protein product [Gulo gulo]|uniref:Uncharacterized protein n=1 Tax=Gulo gulo TaxID=48420 RepID=A0A9X9LVU7_GULGU|nr:unnamed protein product [Gulo gulo]